MVWKVLRKTKQGWPYEGVYSCSGGRKNASLCPGFFLFPPNFPNLIKRFQVNKLMKESQSYILSEGGRIWKESKKGRRKEPLVLLWPELPCGFLEVTKGVTPLRGNDKLLLHESTNAEEGKREVAGWQKWQHVGRHFGMRQTLWCFQVITSGVPPAWPLTAQLCYQKAFSAALQDLSLSLFISLYRDRYLSL